MRHYETLTSQIHTWDLHNKNVFIRADLNVPLEHILSSTSQENSVQNMSSFKLRAILPTLDLIIKKGGTCIIGTHIGRPDPHHPTQNLSTKPLHKWFTHNGYPHLTILENLRFHAGETSAHPEEKIAYAHVLAQNIDYYVNDAFALCHRDNTSITTLATLFPPEKRSIGLLVEKELKALSPTRRDPKKPFVVISGGGKVADKLPYLNLLLGKATTILVCPALSFTFEQTKGHATGKSLVDQPSLSLACTMLRDAPKNNTQLLLPQDYLVAKNDWSGEKRYTQTLEDNDIGIAIGPQTLKAWTPFIRNAKTIFLNGMMGKLNDRESLEPLKQLLHLIHQSNAYRIIGGGESDAALSLLGFNHSFDYVSTGGGASLAYISGADMPGLDIFL